MDIQQGTDGLRELALFAGIGGGILGGKLLGWRTVCGVERNAYCAAVLAKRQNEGHLEPFPIWSDVETFGGTRWRGRVDVISGGFPCQDISCAGKGAGIDGERSGLWGQMARIIGEVRPRYAYLENSSALLKRGIDRVLGDLAEMGFDARWGVFSGKMLGAPIERKRIFIACSNESNGGKRLGTKSYRTQALFGKANQKCPEFWLQAPPIDSRMVNRMAAYVDSVGAIGNGQISCVVKFAWETLTGMES